jgi:hypothetical protein
VMFQSKTIEEWEKAMQRRRKDEVESLTVQLLQRVQDDSLRANNSCSNEENVVLKGAWIWSRGGRDCGRLRL